MENSVFSRRQLLCALPASLLVRTAGATGLIPEPEAFRRLALAALDGERSTATGNAIGVTTTHHLAAAELIVRGLRQLGQRRLSRIVLVGPDHFGRARRPGATTDAGFDTIFGPIACDRGAVARLLALDEVERSDLFAGEHSIGAILPFVRHLFPDAQVVPIALALNAPRGACDRIADAILAVHDVGTAVVQSTDFSHFLPEHAAVACDQASLNVIAAGDSAGVFDLLQPSNLDSRAAQYVQLRVQRALGSRAAVLSNRSSLSYGSGLERTTSYVVARYDAVAVPSAGPEFDGEQLMFGGDVLLGRALGEMLANDDLARRLVERVRALTGGCPLVINLEGLILPTSLVGAPASAHVMLAHIALPLLKAINVQVAVLANNHCLDLGEAALTETAELLRRAGIEPLRHGERTALGAVQITAFNAVGGSHALPAPPALTEDDLAMLAGADSRPLLAFIHWGREYATTMGPSEWALADRLRRGGVAAVIGCHSHRASTQLECVNGGAQQLLFSLGNFLFDQRADVASGALLDMRVFPRGTFFSRLRPIPNLFDEARGWLAGAPRRGDTPEEIYPRVDVTA